MAVIQIPWQHLSPEALTGLIEEFVTRDGTDYGYREILISEKAADAREKIKSQAILILFDEDSETCQLIRREDKSLYV